MNSLFRKIQSNRKASTVIFFVFAIFFGCFSFPVLNFSEDAPDISPWLHILVFLMAYSEMGTFMGYLFHSKSFVFIILLNILHLCVGLICRYLLEFGEVSNTYNFTVPNIITHLLFVEIFCTAIWYYTSKKLSLK